MMIDDELCSLGKMQSDQKGEHKDDEKGEHKDDEKDEHKDDLVYQLQVFFFCEGKNGRRRGSS